MDDESQPNSFSQDVESGNDVVKHVVAQNQQELDEAVKAIKAEHTDPAPDITDPADGNKIVSPDNRAVEDIPSVVDNSVEEVPAAEPPAKPVPAKEALRKPQADEAPVEAAPTEPMSADTAAPAADEAPVPDAGTPSAN